LLLFAALPASALELHTDKDVYAPGEDIQISAFNDSSRLVSFGSSAPYYARNVDTGQIVHFVGLAVMIYLEPGERTSFGILGGHLGAGTWSLEFRYWEDEVEHCCQSVAFKVNGSGTPVDQVPVSRLKARYPRH
jgi:hypothetical protein